MGAGYWQHPLDPETPPLVLPAVRDPEQATERRIIWCRCCGRSTGVPGAVLCAACWPSVPLERREVLGYGQPLVDPTVAL
jgi:hypothetical protein